MTGPGYICHRGIAARQFQRSFVLAEGIEVVGAMLDNGLLHVDLKRPIRSLRCVPSPSSSRQAAQDGADARTIDVTPETGG